MINKFRGDPSLLTTGLDFLEERTGVPVAGVMPYFSDIHIPEEDSLGLPREPTSDDLALVDVAVMRLPHIANFDDFDPLHHESGVRVRYVTRAEEFGAPDLVVIPGSKTTVADLDWLRARGLAERIQSTRRSGRPVVGICAGYQMLGADLLDPDGVESPRAETRGLGLLTTSTTFMRDKATHQVRGRVAGSRGLLRGCLGAEVTAYEIHMGVTSHEGLSHPFNLESRSGRRVDLADGALDDEGLTLGTYLHGIFHNRAVRRSILEYAAEQKGVTLPTGEGDVEPSAEYDKLAALVRGHLDMGLVYRVTGLLSERAWVRRPRRTPSGAGCSLGSRHLWRAGPGHVGRTPVMVTCPIDLFSTATVELSEAQAASTVPPTHRRPAAPSLSPWCSWDATMLMRGCAWKARSRVRRGWAAARPMSPRQSSRPPRRCSHR